MTRLCRLKAHMGHNPRKENEVKLIPELVLTQSQNILPQQGGKQVKEQKAKQQPNKENRRNWRAQRRALSLHFAARFSARAANINRGTVTQLVKITKRSCHLHGECSPNLRLLHRQHSKTKQSMTVYKQHITTTLKSKFTTPKCKCMALSSLLVKYIP